MAPFLRNQWYTAATSAELGERPLARTICNEPLVIFRSGSGDVAVLTDRCPHRKAPLSSGEVVGNDIQCGYHGIRFAPDGACTRVPGNAQIGPNFRARSFPACEIHGLIFVWLGEGALADPALIPDVRMKAGAQPVPLPEIEAERPGPPHIADLDSVQCFRPLRGLVRHPSSFNASAAACVCIPHGRRPRRLTHLRVKATVRGLNGKPS
jgi:nitrite reductase/ring-hydroxylating ferredoxin subunit